MTITIRPFIAAGAAVAAAAVLAACGGSDSSSTQGTVGASVPAATTTTDTSTSTATTEAKTTSTATTEASAEGEKVFTENCAGCHTLKEADASGQVGPNLDDLQPSEATVQAKVTGGGGGMPSFKGQLTDAQIAAVAAFVSSSAGKD